MSDYLTEDWPLGPTSTVYMDGTALYGVRRYGTPGATQVRLRREHADLIREVVAERIKQAKAEAWDEGKAAGLRQSDWEHGDTAEMYVATNPYRDDRIEPRSTNE